MKKKFICLATALSLVAGSVAGVGQSTPVKAAGVEITEENFGTDSFVLDTVRMADENKDNILSDEEAAKVKAMSFLDDTEDISPIVKYFPNLVDVQINLKKTTSLTINHSSVKRLEVNSQNVVELKGTNGITEVICRLNGVKGKVDFSKVNGYENITRFSVSGAGITDVVAPNQSKLTYLSITGTSMGKIDTAKYKKVNTLNLSNNKLKSVNVKKNSTLVSLACYDNKLTSLNISSNKKLKDVGAGGNKLKKLDTSKNKKLNRVVAYGNNIKSYNSASNKKLKQIYMSSNKLTKMDVSKNKELASLYLESNKLTKLDVSKNKKLESLDVSKNKIKTITFSKNNKKLNYLNIKETKLKKLSLPGSVKLSYVYVGKNHKLLKNVKFKLSGYVGIQMNLAANKVYQLTKMIPALKGFKFETTSVDKMTVDEKTGKFKMPKLEKNLMASIHATKGKASVYVDLYPMTK